MKIMLKSLISRLKSHFILQKIIGIILIMLGIIGLFLPFLQGILFVIVGLTLLNGKVPAIIARGLRYVKKKWKRRS